jgi:hypothetical protein
VIVLTPPQCSPPFGEDIVIEAVEKENEVKNMPIPNNVLVTQFRILI